VGNLALFNHKKVATDRVDELQRQFADAAAKSAIVINAISDGIAIVDQKGIIQLFNPAAAAMTGWRIADVTNLDYRSVFKFFDLESQAVAPAADPIAQALANKTASTRDDLLFETTSQKYIRIHIQTTPIDSADGGAIVVFRDITRQKAAEHEQTEFVSTASHEMRTPIAIIEGYIGMLLNPATATLDNRARAYAEKAHASAQHLGRLFQDLLDVTKVDDERLAANPTLIDTGQMAQQVVANFQTQALDKGLTLTYDAPAGVQPIYVIYVDYDQLEEILNNLLENAVKYTPSGQIAVRVSGDADHTKISVSDSGIGVPAEDIPHLFQKFYRVDNSDTREIGGTGLGLYLTKKLTENMSGQIGVDSSLGKGSTFWVEFPRLSREEMLRRAAEIKARNSGAAPDVASSYFVSQEETPREQ
jgi:PAS domain S-box-containing protein